MKKENRNEKYLCKICIIDFIVKFMYKFEMIIELKKQKKKKNELYK